MITLKFPKSNLIAELVKVNTDLTVELKIVNPKGKTRTRIIRLTELSDYMKDGKIDLLPGKYFFISTSYSYHMDATSRIIYCHKDKAPGNNMTFKTLDRFILFVERHDDVKLMASNDSLQDGSCPHIWKRYVGFTQIYYYCDLCDKKKNIPTVSGANAE
jgi:hypothetical protein